MNTKNTTYRIVMAAMLAALTCVATMIIKIPSPLNGYINIGDGIVLPASLTLSPMYSFLAAGLGSALADVLSGYVIYAPATFVIKGSMALIAHYTSRAFCKKSGMWSQIAGFALAELWMMIGYFLFEGVLYGFAPSIANIPANAIQGVVGLALGFVLIRIFEKSKISFR